MLAPSLARGSKLCNLPADFAKLHFQQAFLVFEALLPQWQLLFHQLSSPNIV